MISTNAAKDPAFIVGIPAAELTPKIATALSSLMAEIDRLRHELDVSRDREARLQGLADTDAELPLLNRRALLRELTAVLERGRAPGTDNTFLCLKLLNATKIRRCCGQAAGRAALIEVARILIEGVRVSDVVGCLGGYDLGIILTLANADAAARKAERLAESIAQHRWIWKGVSTQLKTSWGLRALGLGDTADTVVEDADRDLQARLDRA